MAGRNFTRVGPDDRDAGRGERPRRSTLEGPRSVAGPNKKDRKQKPGDFPASLGDTSRAQNLKMALTESIFALARREQFGAMGTHALLTLPKFSYSMRKPFSPPKKYWTPKPDSRLVPLPKSPARLFPTTKFALLTVVLVWEKKAPKRP